MRNSKNYLLFGMSFGALFPMLSLLLDMFVFNDMPFILDSFFKIHASNPLHFIIETAPFILGGISYLAGKNLDRFETLNQNLEKNVRSKTHELHQALEEILAINEKVELEQIELKAQISAIRRTLATAELDNEGRVLEMNTIFLHTLSLEPEQIIGKLFSQVVEGTNESIHAVNDNLEKVLKGIPVSSTILLKPKFKPPVHFRATLTPVFGKEHHVKKVIVMGVFEEAKKT